MSKGQGYGSIIPDANGAESHQLSKTLAEKVGKYVEQYLEAMEKVIIDLLDACCNDFNLPNLAALTFV